MRRWWIGVGLLLAVIATVIALTARPKGDVVPASGEGAEPTRADESEPSLAIADRDGAWVVVVTILDEAGQVAARRDVDIGLAVQGMQSETRTTDEAGRVRLGPYAAPIPDYDLRVRVETATSEVVFPQALPTGDGRRELHATARLSTAPAVAGRVQLPAGVPPEHAYAWIHRIPVHDRDHDYRHIGGERLALTADGRFFTKFSVDEEGDLTYGIEVCVAHEGKRWYGHATGRAPAEDIEVELGALRPGDPAIFRVQPRVADGPAADAFVTAFFDDALDVSHGYDARGLVEGREFCFLWRPNTEIYVRVDVLRHGIAAVGPLDARTTDAVVELQPERIVRGRVSTPDGAGVADVSISAHLQFHTRRGEQLSTLLVSARSDETGAFALRGLGPYPYIVKATMYPPRDSGRRPPDTIRPQRIDAKQATIEFVVQPAAQARIQVLGADGGPVAGAEVEISRAPFGIELDPTAVPLVLAWPYEFHTVERQKTDRAGRCTVSGLDANVGYRVRVDPPAGRRDLEWIERQGWKPRDESFRLAGGLTVAGKALRDNDEPLEDAYVRIRAMGGGPPVGKRYRRLDGSEFVHPPTAYVRPKSPGAFVIGPLAAGRYLLEADGGATVEVTAGDQNVVLRGASSPWHQVDLTIRVRSWRAADRGSYALLATAERTRVFPVGPGGGVVFPHVGVGEVPDLWIALADGRSVWMPKLQLPKDNDAEVATIDAVPARGGVITGRIEVPSGVALTRWRVAAGPVRLRDGDGEAVGGFRCTYGDDGRSFELSGVPPGRWSVEATGTSPSQRFNGAVEAEAGQSVVVRLTGPDAR